MNKLSEVEYQEALLFLNTMKLVIAQQGNTEGPVDMRRAAKTLETALEAYKKISAGAFFVDLGGANNE